MHQIEYFYLFFLLFFSASIFSQNTSAILDLESTTQGLLIPRMTNSEIDDIINPAEGLQVYSIDDGCNYIFSNGIWNRDCALNMENLPNRESCWSSANDVAAFPGANRGDAVSFVLNGEAYVGLGWNSITYFQDFYKFDPESNTWSEQGDIPDFPGGPRIGAVAFVIDDIVYVGSGASSLAYKEDFYAYYPTTNTWSSVGAIADFPTQGRRRSVAFTIDGKGYVGTGFNFGGHKKDFYQYDPVTNMWSSSGVIPDLPGPGRFAAVSFVLKNEAYVGSGYGTDYLSDFYKYDTNTNMWSAIGDVPDLPGAGRSWAVSFILDEEAVVGTGYYFGQISDFYRYNPNNNTWSASLEVPNMPGPALDGGVAFVLNSTAYTGTGFPLATSNSFYSFDYKDYILQSNGKHAEWVSAENSIIFEGNYKVGIGTKTPASEVENARLDVTNGHILVDNDYGIFSKKSDGSLGAGFDTNPGNALFLYSNGSSRMSVSPSGNIGIGTNSPIFPLQIVGNAPTGPNASPNYWLHNTAGHGGPGNSSGWNYSIHASGGIYSGLGFGTGSDARIKNIIGKSDAQEDLNKILAIEVTDYKLKDEVKHGNLVVKKVIAQQVEKILPQAITKSVGTIPNIYQKAKVVDGWIMISTDLKVNDIVKIVTKESEDTHNVLAVEKNRFKVEGLTSVDSNIFVYGQEVEDFRSVDYDAISMMHVSATQAQQQLIEDLQSKIEILNAENKILKAEVSKIETLEERIKNVEGLYLKADSL